MRTPAVRRGLIVLAALAAMLALGLAAASLAVRPLAERALAAQVAGGRASVAHAQLAWFGGEGAAGVRLRGVSLDDGKGRPVLRAKLIEAGLGVDALALLAPAPSRLVMQDFFAAVSVSPQGRYGLGYEAAGPPPPLRLDIIALSLTGKARRDRPLSYLRHLDLERGVLALRQVRGPVAWKAQVGKVAFDKRHGRLSADSNVTIDDGLRVARIEGHARGTVGLKALTTNATLSDFLPARIFPAVSVTKPLSVLDAPVSLRAHLDYAADGGVTAADITGEAGAGALRLGPIVQRLDGGALVTRYDPASKQVVVQTARLLAERTRLDVTGRAWLVPEKGRSPARLEYRLVSPESYLTLAPSAPSQHLTDLTLAGAFVPETGRLETDLKVRLGDAPVALKALAWRGANRRASWGLKADMTIGGAIGMPQVYAFWPQQIAPRARAWLVPRLHSARVTGASLHADIPPGQIDKRRLANDMLRIAFRFTDGAVTAAPGLPGVEQAAGYAVAQGNRLDLTMTSGRVQKLAVSDAVVTVPRFFPKGATATVRARVVGDLGDMLRLIDSPPLRLMGSSMMSPERFSGPADLILSLARPMRPDVEAADHKVSFTGRLRDLRIKDVTLGVDLTGGDLAVDGTLDEVLAEGVGVVGPFKGGIDFRMPLKGREAGRKFIQLAGLASIAGAPGAPIRIDINTRYGIGAAVVRSRLFDGQAQWRKGERMQAVGTGQPAAWRQAGLPAGQGMPARVPVRLTMTANRTQWTGPLEADAYSGALAYSRAAGRTIRYSAEITPQEARRIGVGSLPMFKRAQTVGLTTHLEGEGGWAEYAVGGLDGRVGWSAGKTRGSLAYRFDTTLDNADLAGLGAPLRLTTPLAVQTSGVAARGALSGQANLAGAMVRYDISAPQAGRRQFGFSGTAGEQALARLGLDVGEVMDGQLAFTGRLTRSGGALMGRLTGDFGRAALKVPNSGWAKPAGRAAQGAVDISARDGVVTLQRITADGEGLAVRGAGSLSKGKLSVNLPTARLDGFFDGAVIARRDDSGTTADVNARYLDLRPILKRAQRTGAGRQGAMSLNASIDRVRLSEAGYVRDVKMTGGWGAADQRRVTLTAATTAGSAIAVRAFPDKGGTALALQVANLGDVARTLGGYDNLKGGATTGTGRIVPGGYDFEFEVRDVTMQRVPGAAQLLARGGAIQFDRVVAPMKIRGAVVTLGDVRATGPSVGLTAEGVMDTKARTMNVVGVVTPAYALNAALGGLMGSRRGEGLFGVTYTAKGPFASPKITVNPISLAAPGILRRMFEARTPTAQP
jgi:hypothetical protein